MCVLTLYPRTSPGNSGFFLFSPPEKLILLISLNTYAIIINKIYLKHSLGSEPDTQNQPAKNL